ncbi:MAG: 3-oxoadipate enol-lactonase [Candidatus Binatia bacterium]|nr:MAG: 3-oxoadipate enol-lactonase [Candidatus Binatia bacterium]
MRIDLGTHELRLREAGRGDPVFLCLHGLADTGEIWSKLVPHLAAHGRVLSLDQRAHGSSGAPPGPYRREDLAADVVAVLDRVGVRKAVLVGHSMGGVVALTTALAYPERVAGLLLLGTTSQCSRQAAEWYEKIARAAETDGIEGFRRAIYGRVEKTIEGDAQGLAHVTRCLRSLHGDPLTPRLGELRCPACFLVGSKDPMGTKASEIAAAAVPGAELEVLEGHGHWLHVEAPEKVALAALRLLRRIEGKGGEA